VLLPVLLAYLHAGRIGSYMLAGALAGGLAGGAATLALASRWQGVAYLLANAMLVALGLYLMHAWHGLARVEAGGNLMWRQLQPALRYLLPADSPAKSFALGALWGWLPCGMVYSVLADGAAVRLGRRRRDGDAGLRPRHAADAAGARRGRRAPARGDAAAGARAPPAALVLGFGLLGLVRAQPASRTAGSMRCAWRCRHERRVRPQCCFIVAARAGTPAWHVAIDGVPRAMCCPGCEAVAQAIVDVGQEATTASAPTLLPRRPRPTWCRRNCACTTSGPALPRATVAKKKRCCWSTTFAVRHACG
jgi:hypothetical protein